MRLLAIQSVQQGCDCLGGKPEAVSPEFGDAISPGMCGSSSSVLYCEISENASGISEPTSYFSVSEGTSMVGVRAPLISSDPSAVFESKDHK